MSDFPPFTLPSNPACTVTLREATVSDTLDFADIDPAFEEAATTQFLNRVLTGADPRAMTGDDRRFSLFFYHLHVSKFRDIPVGYPCPWCRTGHTVPISLAALLEGYVPIKGKPFRDILFDGHAFVVHPLLGEDLERLEEVRCRIAADEKAQGKKLRKDRQQLMLLRLLHCLRADFLEKDKPAEEGRKALEEYVLRIPAGQIKELVEKVALALEDMEHGLPSVERDGEILLTTPPVKCPEGKDGDGPGTVLTFPFRAGDYIPYL